MIYEYIKSEIHSLTHHCLSTMPTTRKLQFWLEIPFTADMSNKEQFCVFSILRGMETLKTPFLGVPIWNALKLFYVMIKTRFSQQPLNEYLPNFLSALLMRWLTGCTHVIVPVYKNTGSETKNQTKCFFKLNVGLISQLFVIK